MLLCVVVLVSFEIRGRQGERVKERMDGGREKYPNGSPTTRKAMSFLSASARMESEEDSTMSRSARMTGRP